MTFRTSIFAQLVLAVVGLAIVAPCQLPKQSQEVPGGGDGDLDKRRATEGRMTEKEEQEQAEWASLSPEERLERRIKRGSKSYCRFVASCKPEKLMPGQSGTLVVAALLQGKAVIPSPARVEIMPLPLNIPIDVDQLMIRPAEPGTLAKAYVGQPVYENFAVFEIPVTMAADAKMGDKHLLGLDLKFDLFDGDSAQPIGRFIERVATEIEVGRALDPAVEGRSRQPSAPAAQPAEAVSAIDAGDSPSAGDGTPEEALSGTALVPAPATAPAEEAPIDPAERSGRAPPVPAQDAGLPLPLLIGGGAMLLVIVVLLLRKK